MTNKLTALAATLALTFGAGAANAQEVGAMVMGNDGVQIGTIAANDGANAVVDTGKHKVPLALDSFAEGDNGYTLNITKTELDAMMDEEVARRQAALAAALVVGAEVATADDVSLGTIDEMTDVGITMVQDEEPLTLPREMFALDTDGSLMVLVTKADLDAAIAAAQAS
ncbi:hypothetical protein [Aurantiacibacter flavus]|uniref:PRC-barrel domain-containing protein n=1 Tax=Aurantiacibacter flavus TaxID=3145232 RepID=A0ABV0CZ40_9SPHN